jgi:YVTN family beta-propeller protein
MLVAALSAASCGQRRAAPAADDSNVDKNAGAVTVSGAVVAPAASDAGTVAPSPPPVRTTASVAAGPPVVPFLEVQEVEASGVNPKGAILSHDGATLYVTNFRQEGKHSISVYDAGTLEPRGEIDVPGSVVEGVLSADDKTLYVSNFWRHSVMFIDVATRAVTREVKTGAHPKILALSRDEKTLFSANWSGDSITQIDVAEGAAVRTLKAGKAPRGMAVTSKGRLYAANFFGASIDVYEGPDYAQKHRFSVCTCPRHLALSPDEATLYVSCLTASQLQAIDLATETVVKKAQIGNSPKSIAVSADGNWVYSADYGTSRSVSIISTADFSARVFPVPGMDRGSGIAVSADGRHAYVTGWYDNHVYKIGIQGTETDRSALALRKIAKWRYQPFAADPGD